MEGQTLQLIGSLVAILVLAAIAWALKLGRSANIEGAQPAMALASEKVQRSLDGAEGRKVIVVPDRLVNIVT